MYNIIEYRPSSYLLKICSSDINSCKTANSPNCLITRCDVLSLSDVRMICCCPEVSVPVT